MHLSVPICIPQAPAKSLVTMSKVTSFCGLTWETKSNAAKKTGRQFGEKKMQMDQESRNYDKEEIFGSR